MLFTKLTFKTSDQNNASFMNVPPGLERTFAARIKQALCIVEGGSLVERVEFTDQPEVVYAECGARNYTGLTERVCVVTLRGFLQKSAIKSAFCKMVFEKPTDWENRVKVNWELALRQTGPKAA